MACNGGSKPAEFVLNEDGDNTYTVIIDADFDGNEDKEDSYTLDLPKRAKIESTFFDTIVTL